MAGLFPTGASISSSEIWGQDVPSLTPKIREIVISALEPGPVLSILHNLYRTTDICEIGMITVYLAET